jgi:hypothetical protein
MIWKAYEEERGCIGCFQKEKWSQTERYTLLCKVQSKLNSIKYAKNTSSWTQFHERICGVLKYW